MSASSARSSNARSGRSASSGGPLQAVVFLLSLTAALAVGLFWVASFDRGGMRSLFASDGPEAMAGLAFGGFAPGQPQPAWTRYAAKGAPSDRRPALVIMIAPVDGDLGGAEDLPGPLTLIVPPGSDVSARTAAIRARGHEAALLLPTPEFGDGAPNAPAMSVNAPPKENLRRLDLRLAQGEGFVGVALLGGRFSENAGAVRALVPHLKKKGLILIDGRPGNASWAGPFATKFGAPAVTTRFVLDADGVYGDVEEALSAAADDAARRGFSVALAHAHDKSLAALSRWLGSGAAKSVRLAPATEIALKVLR